MSLLKSFAAMHLVRSLLSVFTCVQLSYLQISSVRGSSSSLWGKKLELKSTSCLWYLDSGSVIPALEELSVCLQLKFTHGTEWTAFIYKAPGSGDIELGLQGKSDHLTLWLFGIETKVGKRLNQDEWHQLCVTWSGREGKLQLYVNGTAAWSGVVKTTRTHLEANGTLSLGRSHLVIGGVLRPEFGKTLIGDISQFRIWSKQWSGAALKRQQCVEADVISWDWRHWKTGDCSAPKEYSLLFDVFVEVEPAADVGVVQSDISARLRSSVSLEHLNVTTDPDSILVLSVDSFLSTTHRPTTVSTVISPGPTQSIPAYPGNTTEEPQEINKTFDRADLFFRVNMTLGITGHLPHPMVSIRALVDAKLDYSNTMKLLNFRIENIASGASHSGSLAAIAKTSPKLYDCMFHVQEDYIYNVSVVQRYVETALNISFSNESISVHTVNKSISVIEPHDCPENETKSALYGTFFWARTFPQTVQEMRCRDPPDETATRLCVLELTMDSTRWARPDMTNCHPEVTIPEIANVTVTPDNAAEVVGALRDLVTEQLIASAELSRDDLDTVVGKLSEVVDVGTNFELGANIVSIMGDILVSKTNVTAVSNLVLSLTSKMGDTMDFQGTIESITAPAMALSLCNVETEGFIGLTFGVSSVASNLEPEVFVDQKFDSDQIQNTRASISLPQEVLGFSPDQNSTRLQFQFYATDELFQDPNLAQKKLNSYIVAASLNNSEVYGLSEKVVVNLRHQKPAQCKDQVQCVFWDFQRNGGQGGWNDGGCEIHNVTQYQTSCLCNHLTHFALLLDVSGGPIGELDSQILTVISYIGCGISAIFLGITLLTYIAFGKLRRDNPSKILINLSLALLGLCMLFLVNSWLSSFSIDGLCIATAATLHYFVLASFTWMGLEALHMYLALVKVFNIYVPSYILKFCAVGWGLPLVIVSLVLAIDKDSYGGSSSQEAAVVLQSIDAFCWVTDDVVFYVTVVGFIVLVLLVNLSVFVVVLIQIKRMRINKPSTNTSSIVTDLRAVASLTVLLGLTWATGLFSFGPGRVVMMYLFCILNTMQGFFVFLFHCLLKENVRKQWRIHLCCGRYRLSAYSDWSRTVSGGNKGKKRHLINMDSDSSATTTTRKISDSLS